jgi:hypothetical protein
MSFRDLIRGLRAFILLSHLAAAAVWIFVMPGGFPFLHLRFLANRGLPIAVIAVAITGIFAARKGNTPLLQSIILTVATAWGFASLAGLILFPISGRFPFVLGMMAACGMLVLAFEPASLKNLRSPITIALCILGGIVGAFVPSTQRATSPATHPQQGTTAQLPIGPAISMPLPSPLAPGLSVTPDEGTVTLRRDRLILTINPVLTFISRSPDRCWTLLAPRAQRTSPPWVLTEWTRADTALRTHYAGIGLTELTVSAGEGATARIESITEIPVAIYSHLNTFCEISINGHTKLALKFSPCPGETIDVLPMDYPVGRPARFAYLDASGVFHVAEARSAEKGPFHDLATGKLERTQPLVITLLDNSHAIASIVLEDWAAQLSTGLSPTAGWGVPQNSIEFSLDAEHARSSASIFITLASTSVGRGFDSVGHAPGIYRNRMTVRFVAP